MALVLGCAASVVLIGCSFVWVRRRLLRSVGPGVLFHVEHRRWWLLWCVIATAMGCASAAHVRVVEPGLAWAILLLTPHFLAAALVDAATQRLPNLLTGLTAGVTTITVLANGDLEVAARAALGALALGFPYVMAAWLSAGAGVGLGDAKLGPTLGALAAWYGWEAWVIAALLPLLLGGIWGMVLLARGASRKARLAFGPFMIVGLWVALTT